MSKPLISIGITSIRSDSWKCLYNSLNNNYKNISVELIIVSPMDLYEKLPANVKYIKTSNIKPSQCYEILLKEFQGDFLMIVGDDFVIHGSLEDLYKEHNDKCYHEGHEKLIIIPWFKFGKSYHSAPYARGVKNAPDLTSTLGAFINRKLIEEIGGFDRRFMGIYMDIDWIMRFYQYGGNVFRTSNESLVVQEDRSKNSKGDRLSGKRDPNGNKLKNFDRKTVNSFWIRKTSEKEQVPSESAYCYYKDKTKVISKYRIKELEKFDDTDIKLYSQHAGNFGWV